VREETEGGGGRGEGNREGKRRILRKFNVEFESNLDSLPLQMVRIKI